MLNKFRYILKYVMAVFFHILIGLMVCFPASLMLARLQNLHNHGADVTLAR